MTELDKLKFTLDEKYNELKAVRTDKFVLDKHIQQLVREITDIEAKIKLLED